MSCPRVLWTVPTEACAAAASARTVPAARSGLDSSAKATRWLVRLSAKAPGARFACVCRLPTLVCVPRRPGLWACANSTVRPSSDT